MTASLVSKLGLKAMKAQPKKHSFGDAENQLPPRKLAVIIGRASKYEIGQSNFGEFTKFRGAFEGTNLETGEVYQSGACFLPNVVESLLVSALDSANGNAVDFALEIGAQFSGNAVGYEYTVKPLAEISQSDELAALRDLSAKAVKALAAPNAEGTEKAAKAKGK